MPSNNRGDEHKSSKVFRNAFSMIGATRSNIPEAMMVALTATATVSTAKSIAQSLQMTEPTIIRQPPERSNIR